MRKFGSREVGKSESQEDRKMESQFLPHQTYRSFVIKQKPGGAFHLYGINITAGYRRASIGVTAGPECRNIGWQHIPAFKNHFTPPVGYPEEFNERKSSAKYTKSFIQSIGIGCKGIGNKNAFGRAEHCNIYGIGSSAALRRRSGNDVTYIAQGFAYRACTIGAGKVSAGRPVPGYIGKR